jgi:hypothetical protein
MKIYKDRETYVLDMLQKYKTSCPTKVLSDIGSGWGWLKEHDAFENGLQWQPFDYVRKI